MGSGLYLLVKNAQLVVVDLALVVVAVVVVAVVVVV